MNALEAGLYLCWQLMSAGKLKVFASLGDWLQEFRLYQRDSEGRAVKQNDHLMDAMRYLIVSGRERMRTKPKPPGDGNRNLVYSIGEQTTRWMQ